MDSKIWYKNLQFDPSFLVLCLKIFGQTFTPKLRPKTWMFRPFWGSDFPWKLPFGGFPGNPSREFGRGIIKLPTDWIFGSKKTRVLEYTSPMHGMGMISGISLMGILWKSVFEAAFPAIEPSFPGLEVHSSRWLSTLSVPMSLVRSTPAAAFLVENYHIFDDCGKNHGKKSPKMFCMRGEVFLVYKPE